MSNGFLERMAEIARHAPLETFLAAFNKNKASGGVKRYMKEALAEPDVPHDLLWWQKIEVLNLATKNMTVNSPAELSVSARVAFELAAADKRLGFRSHKNLKDLSISFGPGVQTQLEKEINTAPRDKYISTRSTIAEKVTKPLQAWLTRNKENVVAQAVKYPDTALFIDRLPENGQDFSIRLHSRKEMLEALYKNRLRTTRDLPAPEKASFKKRIRL